MLPSLSSRPRDKGIRSSSPLTVSNCRTNTFVFFLQEDVALASLAQNSLSASQSGVKGIADFRKLKQQPLPRGNSKPPF